MMSSKLDPNVSADSATITALLIKWGGGDEAALHQLIPLVHREMHQIARRHMARERAGHTLQATALVNEAFLRLVQLRRLQWQGRTHFFAMSARLMRQILVDAARARRGAKRGGAVLRVTLDEGALADQRPDVVALDDALTALEALDARKSQVVELRFFAGLSVEETAEALAVSTDTVTRDWKFAKTWLFRELRK
jgi:RNA polymerase sigma factor (TIGR02999 family)